MPLIEANALKKDLEYYRDDTFELLWNSAIAQALCCIDQQHTIDLETLPIVQQLREELARVTAQRESLLKEIAGECGLCANYEKCKKYPCYCINGNMWAYHGFNESRHTEKSDSKYRNWFMGRFEKEE